MTEALIDLSSPELELLLEAEPITWNRLLRVHDASGDSSVIAIAEDGALHRFETVESPSVLVEPSVTAAPPHDAELDWESPHAVDHFLLGPRLGAGGMAVVHEAMLPGDERRYAVKLMRPTGSSRADLIFAVETAVMRELKHDGIVPLVASGEVVGGLRWLAMPFIPGQTLRRLLDRAAGIVDRDRERLLDAVLLPAFLQLCDAVEHAHGLGVLHCDLKPSNVIVTPEGGARLFDWGMAKTFVPGSRVPGPRDPALRITQVGGTPGYMAPEQILGDTAGLGPWTDVWSLGAVLYELLTGRRAYQRTEADTIAFFRKILGAAPTRPELQIRGRAARAATWATAPRPAPSDLPPLTSALCRVCAWALESEPAARPRTVGVLSAALREAQRDLRRGGTASLPASAS